MKKRHIGSHQFMWLFLLLSFFLPSFVFAATLTLDSATGEYGPGDMFLVTVRLDTPVTECVNAASVELLYPAEWMKPTAISKGESLFSLWAEEPKINLEKGSITFAGGIPAGYCGRVQGDPGKTNVLLRIAFTIPGNMIGGKIADGPVPLHLRFGSSTSVLLNDGFGTPALLAKEDAVLTRLLVSSGLKNEWLDVVHADTLPPDQFSVTVEHDPNMFGGKYFLAFTTVDKQSGINHFEVKEDDPERLDFVRGKNQHAEFVTSPSLYYYELKDQELKSRITVRAVDNARNHIDQIVAPVRGDYSKTAGFESSSTESSTKWSSLFLVGITLFLIGGACVMFFLKRRGLNLETLNEKTTDEHHE